MLSTVVLCPLFVDDEDTMPTTARLRDDWWRLEVVSWADFGLPEGQLKLRQGSAPLDTAFCRAKKRGLAANYNNRTRSNDTTNTAKPEEEDSTGQVG